MSNAFGEGGIAYKSLILTEVHCRLLLRKSALTWRTFAERKATKKTSDNITKVQRYLKAGMNPSTPKKWLRLSVGSVEFGVG